MKKVKGRRYGEIEMDEEKKRQDKNKERRKGIRNNKSRGRITIRIR